MTLEVVRADKAGNSVSMPYADIRLVGSGRLTSMHARMDVRHAVVICLSACLLAFLSVCSIAIDAPFFAALMIAKSSGETENCN